MEARGGSLEGQTNGRGALESQTVINGCIPILKSNILQ